MVAIAFYGQGVRVLDMSDPTDPTQAGYIRIPSQTRAESRRSANNASAAYWHNGYVYTADYTRGIDVLKFTGEIKGAVQPKICWNACDKSLVRRTPRAVAPAASRRPELPFCA